MVGIMRSVLPLQEGIANYGGMINGDPDTPSQGTVVEMAWKTGEVTR